MAFQKIETVKVNNLVGQAFGGYIYACNVSIGFSESPTKIVLNIVSEDAFDDFSSDLYSFNLGQNLYKIEIGSLLFEDMSLISAEETYEVGKHFATVTFVDKSYIMDKIFVGLINRHGKQGITDTEYEFKIKIMCEDCSNLPNFTGKTKPQDVTVKRTLNTGKYVNVTNKGGYILLGEEEFVENKCDLPDINYNFTSLSEILKGLGTLLSFHSSIDSVDLNRNYRQAYVGSLREVLSNWCSDFGFTFYYDFREKAVKFIDLRSPVNNITLIKTELLKYRNSSASPATSTFTQKVNYKKTIEDTYDQNHVSYYSKAATTKNNTYNKYYRYSFSCLTLGAVFGLGEAYKTIYQLYVSCALARYSPDLRILYHVLIDRLAPLGISILSTRFEAADLLDLAVYGFGGDSIGSLATQLDGKVFLISYSPEAEDFWLNWERSLAESFIGRYHALMLVPRNAWDDAKSCTKQKYSKKVFSTQPDTDYATNVNSLPFSNLVSNSNGLGLFFGISFQAGAFAFRIFERNASWGTSQSTFLSYIDPILAQPYKPYILNLDDTQKQRLILALELLGVKRTQMDFLKRTAQQNYDKLALAFIPSVDQVRRVFRVTDSGSRINWAENLGSASPNTIGEQEDCITDCEEDLIRENCTNCNNTVAGFNKPNFEGLLSTVAGCITVSLLGSWANIIFPSQAPYVGYALEENEEKRVIPSRKEVYGALNENLNQNTMGIQVVESNITNDFDAILNENGNYILNAPFPIVEGDGNEIKYLDLTPQDYHNRIHSKMAYSVSLPNESISCEIIGTDFSRLSNFLSPDKGLNSIDVSLDSTNGTTSTLSFSNRPGVLPRKEVYFKNTVIKNALTTIGPASLG